MADKVKLVRGTINGVTVQTSEENAARVAGFVPEGEVEAAAEGYDALTVDELKAELATRNEGREEADLLSVKGRKADLIATLEADDAAADDEDDESE